MPWHRSPVLAVCALIGFGACTPANVAELAIHGTLSVAVHAAQQPGQAPLRFKRICEPDKPSSPLPMTCTFVGESGKGAVCGKLTITCAGVRHTAYSFAGPGVRNYVACTGVLEPGSVEHIIVTRVSPSIADGTACTVSGFKQTRERTSRSP